MEASRLHRNLKAVVALEASRMRNDIPAALEAHGLQVDISDPYSFYVGCVGLVLHEEDAFIGIADPRRDGSAGGPHS